MSYPQGSCGKPQEAPVLLTQSCTTLLACMNELRNWMEQRHSSECIKAVQAFICAHKTSTAAKELSACAPSAPHAMIITLRAAAATKVAFEAEQGNDSTEEKVQDLKHELGGKKARAEASTIESKPMRECQTT
jgi:hypothetical protein